MGLVVLVATAWSLPALSVADYWNITLAIFPLLLTVIACWCRLCGDRVAGLVAVVAFVFTLQAHVGMGLVVTPLARRDRRRGRRRGPRSHRRMLPVTGPAASPSERR